MSTNDELPTLQQVIGRNLRLLRDANGWRQEDVAERAQEAGLDWNRATVAAIELGARVVSLEEFPSLIVALRDYDGELFAGEETVQLGPDAAVRLSVYRALARAIGDGQPGDIVIPLTRNYTEAVGKMKKQMKRYSRLWPGATFEQMDLARRSASGLAEQKAARRLGEDALTVSVAAHGLWGRSLAAERDRRLADRSPDNASPRTIQALRGHITRELLAELAPKLKEN